MLEEYQVKCTSFMVGMALLQNPQVGDRLLQGGHEVARWVQIWLKALTLQSWMALGGQKLLVRGRGGGECEKDHRW
jgi:hypothetical protein